MRKEYICAFTTIMLWGSSAAVNGLLLKSYDAVPMLFLVSTIAAVFLLTLNGLTGRLGGLKKISAREFLKICGLGMLGTFFYNVFLLYGMTKMQAQQAFIINYLWPIFIVLFSCLLLGERMTLKKIISMLLSFFGVAIVATEGNFAGLFEINFLGVGACIGAAVCYGLFSVLTMKEEHDKFLMMMIYYFATAVVCLAILWATGTAIPSIGMAQLPIMLWNGVLVYALAYALWAVALDHGETSKISNLAYLTPFVSLIWIYFLLGEPIGMSSLVGLVFILLGVLLQILKTRQTLRS